MCSLQSAHTFYHLINVRSSGGAFVALRAAQLYELLAAPFDNVEKDERKKIIVKGSK